MKNPVVRLGKVGNVVWGRNRHGQTCYPLVLPTNPRTVEQQANRGTFGSVASEWRGLREEYREEWNEAGPRHQSRRRLGQSGPLTGFNYFMKVNAARLKRGLPLLERPPQWGGRRTAGARAGVKAQGANGFNLGAAVFRDGKGQRADGRINGPVGLPVDQGLMERRRGCWQAEQGLAPGAEGCKGGWRGQVLGRKRVGAVLVRWHYGILSVAERWRRRGGAVRAGP